MISAVTPAVLEGVYSHQGEGSILLGSRLLLHLILKPGDLAASV